jgi:hypothetical protein
MVDGTGFLGSEFLQDGFAKTRNKVAKTSHSYIDTTVRGNADHVTG